MTKRQKLVTVASFRDLPNAGLAKSRLEGEGIPCFLANEHLIGISWVYSDAVGGVKVRVPEQYVEQASMLLQEDRSDVLARVEYQFGELDWTDLCERCGSSDIEVIKAHRRGAALSLLLSFPFVFFRKRNRCRRCGYTWKPKET